MKIVIYLALLLLLFFLINCSSFHLFGFASGISPGYDLPLLRTSSFLVWFVFFAPSQCSTPAPRPYSPLRLPSFLPSIPACWIQGCLETPLPPSPEGANGERMLAYGGALAESCIFLDSFEHGTVEACARGNRVLCMRAFCGHACAFVCLAYS